MWSTLRYEKSFDVVYCFEVSFSKISSFSDRKLRVPKNFDCSLIHCEATECGDVEVEKKIEEKITQFIDRVEKHPNRKNQICLSFFEVKNKQASWFTTKVERFYWEYWYINLNVAHHPKGHPGKSHLSKVVDPGESASEERSARRTVLESSLREVMFQIIKFVNEKKDHIPAISNLDCVTFPYEITISSFILSCSDSGVQYGCGFRDRVLHNLNSWGYGSRCRFCFWDGCDQEDATDWASNHAQLIGDVVMVANLHFMSFLRGSRLNFYSINFLSSSSIWKSARLKIVFCQISEML
ncbi:putative protein translation factor SUI1 -like protein 2-like [Capsicum annuum]|nr:putative protein translation factor SUI1 -like protein 2-like [Capsicum annuum]